MALCLIVGLLYEVKDLLCCQFWLEVIFFCQFFVVVTVVEFLFQTECAGLHIAATVGSGNLFSKTAIENSVFHGHYQAMILFEGFQKVGVQSGDIGWVDDGGMNALLFQFCCCRFTPGKEGSSNEDSL